MSDLKKRSGADLRAQAAARVQPPVSSRQQRLDAYREVIVRRQRDFVETGTALGLIAKENLFKEAGFASFEAMVVGEFDMSTSTAYRLVDAARVVTILSQVGTVEAKIRNQTQALALAPLGKDREAMVLVITAAESRGRVTADLLTDVRVELYPHTKVIDGEVIPARPPLVAGMRAAIEGVADNQKASPGTAGPVDGAEGTAGIRGPAVPSDSPTTAAEAASRLADGGEDPTVLPPAAGPGPTEPPGEADRPGPVVNPENLIEDDADPVSDDVPQPPPAPAGVSGDVRPAEPEELPSPPSGEADPVPDETGVTRPAPDPSDPAALLVWFADRWSCVDFEAAGPLLTSTEMQLLDQSLLSIANGVEALVKWRERAQP